MKTPKNRSFDRARSDLAASPPLSFVQYLTERLKRDPPKQKGVRTREAIKIAAASLLEQCGFHAVRIVDITQAAGLAEGSFYIYFRDKTEVTRTVLQEFMGEFVASQMVAERSEPGFKSIQKTNRRWIAVARQNAGLFRSLVQFSDLDPEFAQVLRKEDRRWYEKVLNSVTPEGSAQGRLPLLLIVYFLGGMMDELMRKLIIYPDEELCALLEDMGASDEDVADAASLVWTRILYPDAIPPRDLSKALSPILEAIFLRQATQATPLTGIG